MRLELQKAYAATTVGQAVDRFEAWHLFEKRKANGCFGYEVIIVQRYPKQTIRRIRYPAREAMPSSADWGISGWSYQKLDDAKRKFKALGGQTAGKDQKQHAPAKRRALPALA